MIIQKAPGKRPEPFVAYLPSNLDLFDNRNLSTSALAIIVDTQITGLLSSPVCGLSGSGNMVGGKD